MSKAQRTTKSYAYSALFSALIALCAWICVPSALPFTLQTLAISLAAVLLGARLSFISVLVYLLLGAIGLPVFSGFRGGLGIILSPTGGFLLGFLSFCLITGALSKKLHYITAMLLGLASCYITGCLWYAVTASVDIKAVVTACVLPFILPDFVKIIIASGLAKRLRKHIK